MSLHCHFVHTVVLLKLSPSCQSLSYLSFNSWGDKRAVVWCSPCFFFYFSVKIIPWYSKSTKRSVKVAIKLDRNTKSHNMFNTTCKNCFAVSISLPKVHLLSWLSPRKSFSLSPSWKHSTDSSFISCSEFCNWLQKKDAHVFIDSSLNPSKAIPRFAGTICMSRRNVESPSQSTCLCKHTTTCKRHLHTLNMPPG